MPPCGWERSTSPPSSPPSRTPRPSWRASPSPSSTSRSAATSSWREWPPGPATTRPPAWRSGSSPTNGRRPPPYTGSSERPWRRPEGTARRLTATAPAPTFSPPLRSERLTWEPDVRPHGPTSPPAGPAARQTGARAGRPTAPAHRRGGGRLLLSGRAVRPRPPDPDRMRDRARDPRLGVRDEPRPRRRPRAPEAARSGCRRDSGLPDSADDPPADRARGSAPRRSRPGDAGGGPRGHGGYYL